MSWPEVVAGKVTGHINPETPQLFLEVASGQGEIHLLPLVSLPFVGQASPVFGVSSNGLWGPLPPSHRTPAFTGLYGMYWHPTQNPSSGWGHCFAWGLPPPRPPQPNPCEAYKAFMGRGCFAKWAGCPRSLQPVVSVLCLFNSLL